MEPSVIDAAPLSWAIILITTLGVPLAGFWAARHTNTTSYMSMGRSLSLPAFVATLVATWYGGVLAVGEYTWTYGLVNWLALGAFYYLFAAIYAWLLASRVRGSSSLSLPEEIAQVHGPLAGKLAALYTLVMVSPAPHILTTAIILGALAGLPLAPALAVTVLLTVAYVWKGGLRSVVVTDMVQFLLMFLGFGAGLWWLASHHGGLDWLAMHVPRSHLEIPGSLPWSTLVLWGFVALWTLVDPGFHQRVAVAKDTSTARRGIWISILCWFLFDALTTGCGLYARALLPDLKEPVRAFPQLARLLPPLIQGLFVGGMLATVLSTLNSLCFLSGTTFSRDLLPKGSEEGLQTRIRWGVLITSVLGALLAWRMQSVVQMWILFASLGVPVLLPALLGVWWPALVQGARLGPRSALASMLAAAATGGLWMLAGFWRAQGGWPIWPLGLEPLYPGLLAGMLPFALRKGSGRQP